MKNIEIVLVVSLVTYFLFNEFDKRVTRVKFRIKERNFTLKYPKISSTLRHLSIYLILGCICAFLVVQFKYGVLSILLYTDPLVLTIAIFTMYGIYISFIQFLISYSSGNSKDLYWGKSKTKLILMDTIEYRVFNSLPFRALLLYLALCSLVNVQNIHLLKEYHAYADSLFYVALAIIIIEYIFLFIKGLVISNLLFYVQEDGDRITRQVRISVFNEYQHAFSRSLKSDEYDFVEWLFYDVSNVEESQREEMLYQVMNHFYSSYERIWGIRNNRVAVYLENLLNRLSREDSYLELYKVRDFNRQFWFCYDRSGLKLSLKKLMDIYIKQENYIFNFINKESGGDKEAFSTIFESFYEVNGRHSNNEKIMDCPEVIWNAISSTNDVILLSESVRKLRLIKCLNNSMLEDDSFSTTIITDRINRCYCEFLISILKRKKELIILMNDAEISTVLDLNNCNAYTLNHEDEQKSIEYDYLDFEKTLDEKVKAMLLRYIRDLENSEDNQRIIKKIAVFLDVKYIVFFICYRILNTGPDGGKWKSEILFYKDLIFQRSYNETVLSEENIQFASKLIVDERFSLIGHRIGSDLVSWILHSIKSPINEKLVNECLTKPYLSLSVFISFRYIFKDVCTGYEMFQVFDKLDYMSRAEFIMGVSTIRNVMCEDYFVEVIYSSFGYHKSSIDISTMVNKFGFESFMTVANFINMESFVVYIGTNKWINNNNVFFFILMMFGEFDSQKWLQSLDVESSKEFAREYERIISKSSKAPEEFVDELINRALRMGIITPPHKKEKIVDTLRMLILQ